MADQNKSMQGDKHGMEDKQGDSGNKAGQSRGGNFADDPARASEAGKKGGQSSSGNFANDPERASEAGKKGGEASHGGRGKG